MGKGRVLVGVRRAVDYAVKVRVRPDGGGVETADAKHSMNPFCAIALEAAIKLREGGAVDEVVVATVAEKSSEDVLRHALAVGADRALRVDVDTAPRPRGVARALAAVVALEDVKMVVLGKVSIDGDHNATGQMLAGMLDWPQATFASNIELQGDEALVTREVDDGLETLAVQLPAVVTCDLRLNEPRFAKLANVMKARKKKIETLQLDDVDLSSSIETLRVDAPPARKAGVIVRSVEELMTKLRDEAKVL